MGGCGGERGGAGADDSTLLVVLVEVHPRLLAALGAAGEAPGAFTGTDAASFFQQVPLHGRDGPEPSVADAAQCGCLLHFGAYIGFLLDIGTRTLVDAHRTGL